MDYTKISKAEADLYNALFLMRQMGVELHGEDVLLWHDIKGSIQSARTLLQEFLNE